MNTLRSVMTRGRPIAWTVLAMGLMLAGSAWADDPPVGAGPPPRKLVRLVPSETPEPPPPPKPTWFIAELGFGPAFGTFSESPVGIGLRGTFGVGGGPKGWPVRFYFVTAARYTWLTADVRTGTTIAEIRRQLADISGGLRTYVTFGRLRMFAEITLGASLVFSDAVINQRETYSTDDARFAVYVAGGAQYRLHRNLSLGIITEFALPTSRPVVDLIGEVARIPDTNEMMGWTAVYFSATGHF